MRFEIYRWRQDSNYSLFHPKSYCMTSGDMKYSTPCIKYYYDPIIINITVHAQKKCFKHNDRSFIFWRTVPIKANQTIKPRYLPHSKTNEQISMWVRCISDLWVSDRRDLRFHNSDWHTKGGEVNRLSTCPCMPLFSTVAWIQKNSQSNYTTDLFPYYSYHAWNYVCESWQKHDPPMFIHSFPIKEDRLSPLSCNKEYESRHAPMSTPFPITWTTRSSPYVA